MIEKRHINCFYPNKFYCRDMKRIYFSIFDSRESLIYITEFSTPLRGLQQPFRVVEQGNHHVTQNHTVSFMKEDISME